MLILLVDEDDKLIDQGKDKFDKKIEQLKEIVASYSLLVRQAPNKEAKRKANFRYNVFRQIMDLTVIQREQYEQINKQAKTIITLRKDITILKTKLRE